MSDTETLYDQTLRTLKNNKVVVVILIAFAAVLGVGQLRGVLVEIKDTFFAPKTEIRISAFTQRYDFMIGNIEPPKPLEQITIEGTHLGQAAEQLAKQIASVIGPTPETLEAALQIEGTRLRSTQACELRFSFLCPPWLR